MNENIITYNYQIDRFQRNHLNGHRSPVIWFTGLSGSGKSTIANQLEQVLFKKGIRTYTLDGDNIRIGLNKGLAFSTEDRQENIRRVAEVAKLFNEAGVVVITAFISPFQKDRELARKIIGTENFLEIFVNTPLEICEERDVKGLYKKARAGEIGDFTGISSAYEAPVNPDLELNTKSESIEESVQQLVQFLMGKLELQ